MKNSIKFLVLTTMLGCVACTTNTLDEGIVGNDKLSRDLPSEITVSFYDEATSRIQLDNQCRTTWTEDDELSVFYFSDANNRFLFMGDTGDRNGALVVEDNRMGEATAEIDKVVLVYPYSDKYKLNASSKSIGITIPGTQYYLNGSYGVGANIMTSVGTTNDFSLKSVCGWIKVQLTGAASVTEVSLTGNNKEQLAGDATLYYEENRLALLGEEGGPDDNSQVGGTLFFGEYVRTITLDCGEGIALSSNTPTEFYFVLAPQTFDEGITIKATLSDGSTITKSTSKSITIERNVITPMAAFDVQPSNEIWYTSTDGEIVTPYSAGVNGFGANIVSNTYENGKGVITFDGDVTKIGDHAFTDCSSLTSVTIPDSVTQIGYMAFSACSSLAEFRGKYASEDGRCLIIGGTLIYFAPAGLTEYTIPESVTVIGNAAFYYCYSLTSVTIPDSVTQIGVEAFSGCSSLTSITIPDSVTIIENYAFSRCTSLTNITIPDSVTQIGVEAFAYCSSLASVSIGNGVTSIGYKAFYNCSSLAEFNGKFASSDGRCLIIDGVLNSFAPAGLTEYTIPDSVTSIGDYAFAACKSLASVIIPDSVTWIGDYAFSNCTSLTSVTIPDSVTIIENYAFSNCTSLTSVTIPDSVTQIGNSAFSDCTSLTSITIPDSVTIIENYAFSRCTSLTNISIPDSVTQIGYDAFAYCSSLASVTIPDSVTQIGGFAFWNCTSLTSVYCEPTTPPGGNDNDNMFSRNNDEYVPVPIGCTIYVPTESVEAYKVAEGWKEYADYIEPYVFE